MTVKRRLSGKHIWALLLVCVWPTQADAQSIRLGTGGIEFGSRRGFVWAEAIFDKDVHCCDLPISVRLDLAAGRRSWGLKRGYTYQDGRTRINDPSGQPTQPDDAFEQWGFVATAGFFLMIGRRFGPGFIVEGGQVPKGGADDEPNEDTSLVAAALSFSQRLGRGFELSALWNATPEGNGRFRTTIVWVLR